MCHTDLKNPPRKIALRKMYEARHAQGLDIRTGRKLPEAVLRDINFEQERAS